MAIDWAALNAFLDRWGFPVVLLIAIGAGLWLGVWPLIQKRIARVDKLLDEQQAKLETNQKEYQAQADERVRLFAGALQTVANSFNQGQANIAQSINDHDTKSGAQHAQIVQALQTQALTLQQINENLVRLTQQQARRTRRP